MNTKEDNKDIQLLKDKLWQQRTTAEITMIKRKTTIEEGDILKEIKRNTTREKKVVQALKKEDSLTWEENRMVYIEGRIYVPNNKKIKEEILKKNHDLVDVGHLRQYRMLELIKRTYWWPGQKENIKKYVQGCFKCQQNKFQYQKKARELHQLDKPQGPW